MAYLKDDLSLVQGVRFVADSLEPHGYKLFTSTLREAADEIEALRELLRYLHRKGGLGLDVHERIEKALTRNP